MIVVDGRPAKNLFTYSARSTVASGTSLQHEVTQTIGTSLQAVFDSLLYYAIRTTIPK